MLKQKDCVLSVGKNTCSDLRSEHTNFLKEICLRNLKISQGARTYMFSFGKHKHRYFAVFTSFLRKALKAVFFLFYYVKLHLNSLKKASESDRKGPTSENGLIFLSFSAILVTLFPFSCENCVSALKPGFQPDF